MNTGIGLLLALVGGGIQGAFFFPMKYMKNWRWENGWFLFSLFGCLVFPAVLAFLATPDLAAVYRAAGLKTAGLVFFFGLCWGVGAVLYGLGVNYLGMAMGVTIITGINVCLGTMLPALCLSPGTLTLPAGLTLSGAPGSHRHRRRRYFDRRAVAREGAGRGAPATPPRPRRRSSLG